MPYTHPVTLSTRVKSQHSTRECLGDTSNLDQQSPNRQTSADTAFYRVLYRHDCLNSELLQAQVKGLLRTKLIKHTYMISMYMISKSIIHI